MTTLLVVSSLTSGQNVVMGNLVGIPSDDVPEVLAAGGSGVSTIFVSMSMRHPEGKDADYLYWHTYDHRPEQHRLASVRASLRLVSTAGCRKVRALSGGRYEDVDHVMTYFFRDTDGLQDFKTLSVALGDAGRKPYLLPVVQRGVYHLDGVAAAPRIKAGADVLPWWPAQGVYLLVEQGLESPANLTDVPGVGGAWWGSGVKFDLPDANSDVSGLQITYCFLDADPVATAERLRPRLENRWKETRTEPLFAAPFFTLVQHDVTRHLP